MNQKDLEIIESINQEAQNLYKDKLHKEEYADPEIRMLVNKALTKHRSMFSEEQLKEMEAAKKLGYFDKKIQVVNKKVAKEYDAYVQRRQVEEIKKGNLTNPKDTKEFKEYKKHVNTK